MDTEPQQQQPMFMPNIPYESPMNTYGSSILTLTNPAELLRKLELTYRNQVELVDGSIKPLGKPLMNDEGINSIIGIICSVVNQVTIFSNLSRTEISVVMEYLSDTLIKDMLVNREKYGITSPSARDKILFTALSTAFICMKRAIEGIGNEKGFWKGSQQEITTRVEGQKTKSGLLSGIMGWKK